MGIRIKRSLNWVKEHPVVPLSATGVGLSAANLSINAKRSKRDREYQEKNLIEMQKLTRNLGKVNNSLEKTNQLAEEEKKTILPKFRLKGFSNTVDRAIEGATIGSAVGTFLGGSPKVGTRIAKFVPGGNKLVNKLGGNPEFKPEEKFNQSLALMGTSVLVGAALGAIVGAVQDINQHISRKNIGNDRDMTELLKVLKDRGLEENRDFTRSPKTANLMKTKVCIVLQQGGDATEFNVMINSVNDRGLKVVLDKCISKIRPLQTKSNQANNRYNELTLTTVKNKTSNVRMVADLVENLVNSGYQVYIVEAG